MKYLGLISFFMVFTLVYIIARGIAFSNRNIDKRRKKFYEDEEKANSTRRADISNLNYIVIDMNAIPLDSVKNNELIKHVQTIKELSDKRIIDLSSYTNTELKLMYGPANLDALSLYDENYTTLIQNLDALGNGLIKEGDIASGKAFLEYAISIGSDLTNTFMGLSDIYVAENNKAGIKHLIKEASKISSLLGPSIKHKLENKLDEM